MTESPDAAPGAGSGGDRFPPPACLGLEGGARTWIPATPPAAGRTIGPGPVLLTLGLVASTVAALAAPGLTADAAARVWAPFVLVAGLLAIGLVAHGDGLFDAVAARLGRLPGGSGVLLVALLMLVAVLTAVLNLDTSVAFLTPILVLTARSRGVDEEAFLYGAVLMSNSASLLLPGSNLTNLLILADTPTPGATFATRMLPAWVAAVAVTVAVLVVRYRHRLRPVPRKASGGPLPPLRLGAGVFATGAAAALVVALPEPAVPVLLVAAVVVALRLRAGGLRLRQVAEAVDPAALIGLFGLAVAVGAVAGAWDGPARLLDGAGSVQAATVGALGAVALNNLPAAALLGPHASTHSDAVLIGLNLGPNLAVTGSLSALLWFQAARRVGVRPSLWTFSRIGVVLVPLSIAAALAALASA